MSPPEATPGAAGSHTGPRRPRADSLRNQARILAAAEEVFAEHGPTASTREIARRAGVAVGTVFSHFPTKQELLRALLKDLMRRLTEQAEALAADGDPATALFAFLRQVVERAARQKTVVDLLAETGTELRVADALRPLHESVDTLLDRARRAGAVRAAVRTDEVVALLASTCQGAVSGGWDATFQRRVLDIVVAGLRAGPGDGDEASPSSAG